MMPATDRAVLVALTDSHWRADAILAAGFTRRGAVAVTDEMVRAFWEADDCEDCREWAFGYERTRHCLEAALAARDASGGGSVTP
jgi:hypothetical protein